MDRPLLGLVGYKGSGKDSVARILVEDFGYVRRAFADALRDELAETIHGTPMDEESIALRTAFLVYIEQHKYDDSGSPSGWPRMLMQAWGVMRRDLFGPDYWVQKVPLLPNVVISDVRFPNEAVAVKAAGGVLWAINRPGRYGDGHASESHIKAMAVDLHIPNTGDLGDLASTVYDAMVRVLEAPAPTEAL